MKQLTKVIDVYQFNELSEIAKGKAINLWYEGEEYIFLGDDILTNITENLDGEKVLSNINLSYSLSYSQGDGLSFSADFDFEKWLQRYDFQNFKKRALLEQFSIVIKANKGHYCYAHKDCVNMQYQTRMSYFVSNLSNLEQLADSILEDVTTYYLQICKTSQRYGYEILEYRMNNEEFIELCDANDYNFDINGNMINL